MQCEKWRVFPFFSDFTWNKSGKTKNFLTWKKKQISREKCEKVKRVNLCNFRNVHTTDLGTPIYPILVLHSVEISGFFCHSDFYVKSIFWDSRSFKMAIFAHFGALNFVALVNSSLQELLESSKLISRKIWVIGKSWNFHIVYWGAQVCTLWKIWNCSTTLSHINIYEKYLAWQLISHFSTVCHTQYGKMKNLVSPKNSWK